MQLRIKSTLKSLQQAFQEWQQDKASLLAATSAYYTVFSITPLLVLAIAIAGTVFGQDYGLKIRPNSHVRGTKSF